MCLWGLRESEKHTMAAQNPIPMPTSPNRTFLLLKGEKTSSAPAGDTKLQSHGDPASVSAGGQGRFYRHSSEPCSQTETLYQLLPSLYGKSSGNTRKEGGIWLTVPFSVVGRHVPETRGRCHMTSARKLGEPNVVLRLCSLVFSWGPQLAVPVCLHFR